MDKILATVPQPQPPNEAFYTSIIRQGSISQCPEMILNKIVKTFNITKAGLKSMP